MSTAIAAARPAPSLLERLRTPRALIFLVILMWGPLTAYVMFGGQLGAATTLCAAAGDPGDRAAVRPRDGRLARVAGSR